MKTSKEETLIKSTNIWIVCPLEFSRFCHVYGLMANSVGLNYSSLYGFNPLIVSSVFVGDFFKHFDKSREQIVKLTINHTDIFQGVVEKIKTTQYVFDYKQGQELSMQVYELKDDPP